MRLSIYIELLIRILGYCFALWFLFFPGRRTKYWKVYRWIAFTAFLGAIVGAAFGLSINPPDLVMQEASNLSILPAALGVCGFVSCRKSIRNSPTIIAAVSFVFVCLFAVAVFSGVDLLGGIVKGDSSLIAYLTALTAIVGLWQIANGSNLWLGRATVAIAWFTSLYLLHKWNYLIVLFVPVVWITMEAKGRYAIIRRLVALVLVGSVGFTVYRQIDRIALSSRDQTFDEYLDANYRARVDPSSGRLNMWQIQLEGLYESPLVGIGLGSVSNDTGVEDHNAYVFFLSRFGVVNGLLYLVLVALAALALLQATKPDKRCFWIALLLVGNVAFVIGVGESYTFSPVMYFAAFIGGLLMQSGARASERPKLLFLGTTPNAYRVLTARVVDRRFGYQSEASAGGNGRVTGQTDSSPALPFR